MKRDLAELSNREFDVIIVGAGIYGAATAWDAALRGLSVALVERGDFASGNSANTLKIVHGGLRYLQNADFRRMRRSIRERAALLRIAPHLVHPLPFVMPTHGHLTKGKLVMRLAMAINDIVGLGTGGPRGDPAKAIPAGRVVSRQACLEMIPGIGARGVTGAAIWHDAQMFNSERLVLSFVLSAAGAGAQVANYVEATGFLRDRAAIRGLKVRDALTGEEFDIRSRIVITCCGPRTNAILSTLGDRQRRGTVRLSTAMNLVVNRRITPDFAIGVRSRFEYEDAGGKMRRASRILFLAPWRDITLVGTRHRPCMAGSKNDRAGEEEIQDFIAEVNRAFPGAQIRRDEVTHHHWGLIPMDRVDAKTGEVRLTSHFRLLDHSHADGIGGLVSVVGMKYTTARYVAQKAVDLAFRKLGKKPPACITLQTALYGGDTERFGDFLEETVARKPRGLSEKIVRHLIYTHGSEYHQVLKRIDENPEWGETVTGSPEVITAEVVHAVRLEMAQKLTDLVLRRTDLGSAGKPGEECLRACAKLMARELGWDTAKTGLEIKEANDVYSVKP